MVRSKMPLMPKHLSPFLLMLPALLIGCAAKPAGDAIDLQLQRMRDPQIGKMLTEIDRRQIDDSVRTLVSFKTRHTLSDTKNDREGIGAARRWIKSQFDRYSRESGGGGRGGWGGGGRGRRPE